MLFKWKYGTAKYQAFDSSADGSPLNCTGRSLEQTYAPWVRHVFNSSDAAVQVKTCTVQTADPINDNFYLLSK